MRAQSLISCLLVAALVHLLAPRLAAADLPEVVKRYINDVTLIVGRIDVEELRTEAVEDFVRDLLREAPERERADLLEVARAAMSRVDERLAPLRERGVTTAWFVMGPDSFIQNEPALFIVPVTDDEQAKAVTDLLTREREAHKRVNDAVLIGSRQGLASAQSIRPVDRPVLGRPFTRERGAPALQMVFEPTPVIRIAAELGLRQLVNQSRGAVPPEFVDYFVSMESMNLALSLPPRARSAMTIQFPDEKTAEEATKFLDGQVRRMEEGFKRNGIEEPQARQLTEAFLPETRAKRVVLELTPEELRDTVGPTMVLTMIRGREGGMRVRAGRNLKLLTQAILLWSYEKGEGRLPPELAAVEQVFTDPKTDGGTWRSVRRNPRYNVDDAFAYVRPAERLDQIREPDITVIAYEKPPADGIREGVNVAFADGHVEWMEAADFEELAAAQGFEIVRLPRR